MQEKDEQWIFLILIKLIGTFKVYIIGIHINRKFVLMHVIVWCRFFPNLLSFPLLFSSPYLQTFASILSFFKSWKGSFKCCIYECFKFLVNVTLFRDLTHLKNQQYGSAIKRSRKQNPYTLTQSHHDSISLCLSILTFICTLENIREFLSTYTKKQVW